MPKVSISKAAKLADLSRQHFYEAYIKTGKITVDRSNEKRPKIDTAEILRVFGTLHNDNEKSDNILQDITPKKSTPYNNELTQTVKELTDKIHTLEKENIRLQTIAEERKNTLADLRQDRDKWQQQASQLLLTHGGKQETKQLTLWQWLGGGSKTT